MGFDLLTVNTVPNGVFEKVADGKGYFRYSSGVTDVLHLIGVDMGQVRHRKCGFTEDEPPQPVRLADVMSFNGGFQVTTEECEMISSMLTAEAFDAKCLGKVPPSLVLFGGSLLRCPVSSYAYSQSDKMFFLSYAAYCKKASKYGGFYVF
jgi:hypothetical protein